MDEAEIKPTTWPMDNCNMQSVSLDSVLPDGLKRPYTSEKNRDEAMNRDEGSYQLSHTYDRFRDTASSRRVKNRLT